MPQTVSGKARRGVTSDVIHLPSYSYVEIRVQLGRDGPISIQDETDRTLMFPEYCIDLEGGQRIANPEVRGEVASTCPSRDRFERTEKD